jgi:hypothetical protein
VHSTEHHSSINLSINLTGIMLLLMGAALGVLLLADPSGESILAVLGRREDKMCNT